MGQVITALGKLSTAKEVSDAVGQTIPLAAGGTAAAIASTMNLTDRVVQARIEANRGLSAGDSYGNERALWAKPFGAWARQSDRDGTAGYQANSGGLIVGADGVVSSADRVGFAVTYAKTKLDGNGASPQSADIDLLQLMTYGSHNLDADTDISWQLDMGTNKTEGRRLISFGGLTRTANSDYRGTSLHVAGGLARVLRLSEQTNMTPSMRLDYTTVKNKAYAETGAGALSLLVNSQRAKQFILYGDVKFNHSPSTQLTFSGNFGFGYDFLAEQTAVVATFAGGGPAFTTSGIDPKPLFARAGAGVTLLRTGSTELTARYDAEAHRGFRAQSMSLKLRKQF
nr:autotransporter outer membrane beta-barrel domain-containing protein [Massilia frigida]